MSRLAPDAVQVALNQGPANLRGKARPLGVFGTKVAIFLDIAAHRETYSTEGDVMEYRKMVRTQVMLMGLGAALLLASSAYAQQEMDPTAFDVNPGTPHVDKSAVRTAVRTAQTLPAAKKAPSEAAVPASLWSGQDKQEADLARLTIVDATMIVIMMAGICLIVLFAMVATRRERRLRISPQTAPYTPASRATAH
jgi:hypothetical protein